MLSTPRSLGFVLAAILGAMLVPGCRPDDDPAGPSQTLEATPQFSSSQVIPDQYIVVFKSGLPDPAAQARALVAQHGGTLRFTYTAALKGFAAKLPVHALDGLRRNPNVAYIELDQVAQASEVETTPLNSGYWGLDRIDQRTLPFSQTYSYGSTGAGVHVYILDTGIRYTHTQFGGRATFGYDAFGGNGADCDGHGTNVAGVAGASTYGVAKAVQLVSVRVLGCTGSGANSGIIAGIDWVTAHRQLPAVANMSMGGSKSSSVNTAIQNSIKAGVVYAVAAGNNVADACNYSPASTPEVLTVGAISNSDGMAGFSNYGSCVDLYAPGGTIITAANLSDSASMLTSGTSIASPFVTGVAALYLSVYPAATPAEVVSAIVDGATANVLKNIPSGTANLLLYANLTSLPPPPTDTVTPPPLPPPDTTTPPPVDTTTVPPPPPQDTTTLPPPPPPIDQAPLASFSSKCRRGQCTFDASTSRDDHGIVSYTWSFGDGSSTLSGPSLVSVTHTYASAGAYTVTLTVTDDAGQQSSSSVALKFRKL